MDFGEIFDSVEIQMKKIVEELQSEKEPHSICYIILTISQAEFLILKDFDLAELRAYEQAKELAVDLIMKWLVKYKFKDWAVHSDGSSVTTEEKKERATKIANTLSNNNIWKSHGRAINMQELESMNLKINDYGKNTELCNLIDSYYSVLTDYVTKYQTRVFVHTSVSTEIMIWYAQKQI